MATQWRDLFLTLRPTFAGSVPISKRAGHQEEKYLMSEYPTCLDGDLGHISGLPIVLQAPTLE